MDRSKNTPLYGGAGEVQNSNNNLRPSTSTSTNNHPGNLDSYRQQESNSLLELNGLNPLEDQLPPSYEFTLEQTVFPAANSSTERTFRPPPLNQLTSDDAHRILDYAEYAWDHQNWTKAQNHYSTAAAIFRIIEDIRNEAFCLQRLGEICRIQCLFSASRAHILQAHILFGQCGELARQLMCERWLARTASDEGNREEGMQLLQNALENSRAAGLRESEGWCLLRLGEVEGADKALIQQALDIARDEKLSLLEARCSAAYVQAGRKFKAHQSHPSNAEIAGPVKDGSTNNKEKETSNASTPNADSDSKVVSNQPKPGSNSPSSRIGRWFRRPAPQT